MNSREAFQQISSAMNAAAKVQAALFELTRAGETSTIAEIPRRTALAIAPRQVIAEKTADAWLDWLAKQGPTRLPDPVRVQLTDGVCGRPAGLCDLTQLKDFAGNWILQHHTPDPEP